MNDVGRKIDPSLFVWGLILIGVGVVFFLEELDVIAIGGFIRWYWPMILVVIGLPMLFKRQKVWSGLWLITLGLWLQMARLKLWGLTYRNSWPLLLIALGAGITIRALFDTTRPKEPSHD